MSRTFFQLLKSIFLMSFMLLAACTDSTVDMVSALRAIASTAPTVISVAVSSTLTVVIQPHSTLQISIILFSFSGKTVRTHFVASGVTCTTGDTDCYFTYLQNAQEVTGNGNVLCESGETCTYLPNFGAYQGHGATEVCNFLSNGGPVTGVSMQGFHSNGRL